MTDDEHVETMNGGEVGYRAADPELMRFEEQEDGPPILEGRMMPFDEWTEVESSIEGHFMERFAPGALAKTMRERAARIRALFEHGRGFLHSQPIAQIEDMREEADGAYYRASLLEGLPPLLVSGLRRGLYGSSIRFRPIKTDVVRRPRASDANPERIEERTVREAQIVEFSVVTFPQYAGATAQVRSITDELAAKILLEDPARLLQIVQARQAEPQHSDDEEPAQATPAEPSRSTQPSRDYLRPKKGEPSWRL